MSTEANEQHTVRELALITGGTSGIGAAIAARLGATHDLALGFEKNFSLADQTEVQLRRDQPSARVHSFQKKLINHASAQELFQEVGAKFGKAPSILVHCAGRLSRDLFLNSEFATHSDFVEQQLIAGMALTHLCLPAMYRLRKGRIVFISSISASYAFRGQAGYSAAKAGIESFAKSIALEVAHRGITINCVAPGPIRTELTQNIDRKGQIPAGDVGEPSDVANAVRFLCSEEASYITGVVLPVDGGFSLGDYKA